MQTTILQAHGRVIGVGPGTMLPNCFSIGELLPLTTTVAAFSRPHWAGHNQSIPKRSEGILGADGTVTSAADGFETGQQRIDQTHVARSVPILAGPGRCRSGAEFGNHDARHSRPVPPDPGGFSDESMVNIRKFERDLCVTLLGNRRGAARDRRFYASTWARSGFITDTPSQGQRAAACRWLEQPTQ
jgi:hypothetical protein